MEMFPALHPQSQVLNSCQLTHELSSRGLTVIDATQGGPLAQTWPLSVVPASQGHSDWFTDGHITAV